MLVHAEARSSCFGRAGLFPLTREISSRYAPQASLPQVNTPWDLICTLSLLQTARALYKGIFAALLVTIASVCQLELCSRNAGDPIKYYTSSIQIIIGEGAQLCIIEPCPVLDSVPCANLLGYQACVYALAPCNLTESVRPIKPRVTVLQLALRCCWHV